MSDKIMSDKIMSDKIEISYKIFQRMVFITNAIEQGWSVKKSQDSYIFYKKHENKKEIFQADYLEKFIESNLTLPT